MTIHPSFSANPYKILDPNTRWVPGDMDIQTAGGREKLIPPLVHKIRNNVKEWRHAVYNGASQTSKSLLNYWFNNEHLTGDSPENLKPFQWYFAQREAVESAIWLYEIANCKETKDLLKYDSSGLLTLNHFKESWPRYVMKLATGSGKTKVLSLLLVWSYFHRLYEDNSQLSQNFLLIAPNIIVLDRLKVDFEGLKIFKEDPLIPDNGYLGKSWLDDFKPELHIQDDIGSISPFGNIYLTNVHRLFLNQKINPTAHDSDSSAYYLGSNPVNKTNDSKFDLGVLVRQLPDLVIMNDEAHHIHDDRLAWSQIIEELNQELEKKGNKLAAQFDVTATPKHQNGAIFAHTISDYPLCEAICQGVVKQPIIPDEASMAKLKEKASNSFVERYEDHIRLGYIEWKKVECVLEKVGKKAVLFIMTDETRNCDQVKEYLEATYPDLKGGVLVIHTKANGEIEENDKTNLNTLRRASREIDSWQSPYKVVVSVMMLREGWDVQNVTTIVGLRSYSATSKILPEQTLGRGLRRMFRGSEINDEPKLCVIGTQAFIDFVKSIKSEGVDLDYKPMGEQTPAKAPLLIEIDKTKLEKSELDITLPLLTPRMHRNWKNLEDLDINSIHYNVVELKQYSEEEKKKIIFVDIMTEQVSATSEIPSEIVPDYHRALHFFTQTIMRDLRLNAGNEIVFGKLKQFIESRLFGQKVDLNDLNIIRNLSEQAIRRTIIESFKQAINNLTVSDKGTTEIKDTIKISKMRPFTIKMEDYMMPKKSIMNKIVGDSKFELEFAQFLDNCDDIVAYAKNNLSIGFYIDYQNEEGSIANYYPDFIVKKKENEIWIIELKGIEDFNAVNKRERLEQYCIDATSQEKGNLVFKSLYIMQEDWQKYPCRNFNELVNLFFLKKT